MTVGFVGVTGGTFTIVSSLVPMTILITCTATLVYLHSRFVEDPTPAPTSTSTRRLRAGQQVRRLHRVDLRHRRRLRGAGRLQDPADPRDGHLGGGRPGHHLDHGVHALPGAAEGAQHADARRSASRRPVVRAAHRRGCRAGPIAGAGCWCPASLVLSALRRDRAVRHPRPAQADGAETNALEYITARLGRSTRTPSSSRSRLGGLSITEVWLRAASPARSPTRRCSGAQHFSDSLEADPQIGTSSA